MASPQEPGAQQPRVVIVGAGFGGLSAAQSLRHAPVQVTIIDKNNFHLFQPMLYQVATGELAAEEIAAPVRDVLRNQRNAEFVLAEVTGVDAEQRLVKMGESAVPFDYLILATGSHYNYFGHDEWQQHSPSLKTINDATLIRGKLLEAFEAAERLAGGENPDPAKIATLLTFVLVGAGPTGVEMAGAIAEMAPSLCTGYRHINAGQMRVILVDALPRILNSFPEDIAQKTAQKLESLGITLRLNEKVKNVDADGVTMEGKDGNESRIDSRLVLWTAGVVGSAAGQWLGAPTNKDQRIEVNADFSIPGHGNIFAVGDTATVENQARNLIGRLEEKAKPLPGVAQPAIQAGEYVARVIRRRVRGLPPPAPFHYWDKGDLAQVSRGYAVADLKVARFTGPLAWILWLGIHIFFLIGFANRILVLIQWTVTILTSRRGIRDFTSDAKPPVPEVAAAGFPG